ncbi:Ankyrin repeat-containing domain,Ankyrin repeat [Cinara cedri]|uniref:Ankyrin repeat-containing domain,Ankyrin repeat n=1 Tax=Cinara cedri TaxID=506608 RepID=A0A5E4NDZ9_9HEMI|nr:Ankyrin repeat-containing domain,Ankyrin repeat [Cinara cedri]
MLINDQNQNLNSIDKKILDFYRKERFPLHYCIRNGKPEHFYHVFRDFIADCDGDKKYIINERDYNLNTPLHIAVLSLNLGIVEHLLRHEANPNVKNAVNSTPLHIAAHRDKDGSIVQCLLGHRNKANPKHKVNPKLRNIIGSTALHVAVFCKNLKAIEHFFSYNNGAKVFLNIPNNCGETPLDLAKKNQDVLDFINDQRKLIAYHMVTYPLRHSPFMHLANNVIVDINNILLDDKSLILTGLIDCFNRPKIHPLMLDTIRYSIECGARIFKMDGNGKSMMSILVGIKDDKQRRSICNTLEAYKDSLCIEKEKSCVEEMPDGSAKEQMRQLLKKWQSGVELYQYIKGIFADSRLHDLQVHGVMSKTSTSPVCNDS